MDRQELGQSLNLSQELIPQGRRNRPGTAIAARYITIHNTSNTSPGADADAHSRFVRNTGYYIHNGRRIDVSWHYTVDDKKVIKHLPINEFAYHAGQSGNSQSVAIETCMHSGINQPAADDRLARLVAVLRYDLDLQRDRVVPHRHWTGKNCPILLLPKWESFLDIVDGYVRGMERSELAAPALVYEIADEVGETDHAELNEAINAEIAGGASQAAGAIPAGPDLAAVIPQPEEARAVGSTGPFVSEVSPPDEARAAADPSTIEGQEADEGHMPARLNILSYATVRELTAAGSAIEASGYHRYLEEFAAFLEGVHMPNFRPHELLVMGGRHNDPSSSCYRKNSLPPRSLWPNARRLVVVLQAIRDELGAPVTLNSVYRNDAYNACLPDAVPNSLHKEFIAADFRCSSGNSADWLAAAKRVRRRGEFKGGIGVYNTFVHVDVRGYNADWDKR